MNVPSMKISNWLFKLDKCKINKFVHKRKTKADGFLNDHKQTYIPTTYFYLLKASIANLKHEYSFVDIFVILK